MSERYWEIRFNFLQPGYVYVTKRGEAYQIQLTGYRVFYQWARVGEHMRWTEDTVLSSSRPFLDCARYATPEELVEWGLSRPTPGPRLVWADDGKNEFLHVEE